MILRIQVIDDNGEVLGQAEGPAWQPVQWRSLPSKPIVAKRPKNSDGGDNGEYHIHTVTAQPLTTLVMGRSETPVQFPQNPSSVHPQVATPYTNPGLGQTATKNPLGGS